VEALKSFRVAVIAATPVSGEAGGAERFYRGLTAALAAVGTEAHLIEVASDESCFDSVEETYLRCYDLDLSAYDGVISTKAPTFLVRHPNHICYLVHTMRVFYDMFDTEFPDAAVQLRQQRSLVHKLDTAALRPPRTRKVFSIGHEVSRRLRMFNGIDSEVLHPALTFDSFRTESYGPYFFIPGRLHRWKRIDLLIDAFHHVRSPVKLKIAGIGEDEPRFRRAARDDPRIEFLGRVTDRDLVDLYANTLAVPFVPVREDFGYVTLEAFRSAKPVITCHDSGEPSLLVEDGRNGFVCRPDPVEIAEVIDRLSENVDRAREMGRRGMADTEHIRWPTIADRVLRSLGVKMEENALPTERSERRD
jgi:glycosyltransferase involved in cell wall biosynthesis